MHNVTNIFVIYFISQENSQQVENHLKFYNQVLIDSFKSILIVICVINGLALLFLVNLIVFHIELKIKGLTTYEFLKMQENTQGKQSKIVVKITEEMRVEY